MRCLGLKELFGSRLQKVGRVGFEGADFKSGALGLRRTRGWATVGSSYGLGAPPLVLETCGTSMGIAN